MLNLDRFNELLRRSDHHGKWGPSTDLPFPALSVRINNMLTVDNIRTDDQLLAALNKGQFGCRRGFGYTTLAAVCAYLAEKFPMDVEPYVRPSSHMDAIREASSYNVISRTG